MIRNGVIRSSVINSVDKQLKSVDKNLELEKGTIVSEKNPEMLSIRTVGF